MKESELKPGQLYRHWSGTCGAVFMRVEPVRDDHGSSYVSVCVVPDDDGFWRIGELVASYPDMDAVLEDA